MTGGKIIIVADASGGDTEGSAKLTFRKPGDYTATISLENVLGRDVREYPVLRASSALEPSDGGSAMSVYTVTDALVVDFAEAGNYTVEVYDVEGRLAACRSQRYDACGGQMFVTLRGEGVYIVRIESDGKLSLSVKLVKK